MDAILQTAFLKYIFWYKKFCYLIIISLKFVPATSIDNKASMVQVTPNGRQAITWINVDQQIGHHKSHPSDYQPFKRWSCTYKKLMSSSLCLQLSWNHQLAQYWLQSYTYG